MVKTTGTIFVGLLCLSLPVVPAVPSYENCQYQVFDDEINKYLKQPYYLYNNTTPVPNVVIGRFLSSKTPECFCIFDAMNMAVGYKSHSNGPKLEIMILVFGIFCDKNQNVIFTNILEAKLYLQNFNVMGFLFLEDCGIDVNNIRILLEITRFYVANFENLKYNYAKYSLLEDENMEKFECIGMDYLYGLYVRNVYRVQEFLRDLHVCNTSYPNMAIVYVSSRSAENFTDVPEFINVMYPNIQSVSIVGTGLLKIPRLKFTDCEEHLPHNLYASQARQRRNKMASYIDYHGNIFQKTFDLSGNRISSIPKYAFEGRIHMIVIEENEVISVAESAFWKVQGLRLLRMKENNISRIPELLFVNQTGLRYLDISKNFIRELNSKLFMYVPNLQFIDLSYNRLTMLPDE